MRNNKKEGEILRISSGLKRNLI